MFRFVFSDVSVALIIVFCLHGFVLKCLFDLLWIFHGVLVNNILCLYGESIDWFAVFGQCWNIE